jgi:hypothetical protein
MELPPYWRTCSVLKRRRDSDSHPPPAPAGGRGVCTGPNFTKRKKPDKKQHRCSVFLFPTLKSIASMLKASARWNYCH